MQGDKQKLKNIIEALLFVSDKPLSLEHIREVVEVEKSEIKSLIEELRQEYLSNHCFRLREVAGGYQMVTDPEYAQWLRKLFRGGRKEKLSRPALETLAIIAYKQPVTKPEIEHIRGVDADGVVRTLLERGLIRIAGRKNVLGRPILYATTKKFLEYFGLNSLNDLPPLDELVKMEETDGNPQDTGEN
ncbi:MAG: SMC-Scp complex subunit ScpB [Candidatus Omnitrophica bacterium 4484_49]|nr:SMC-Scp complex subunit ScpB [Candidatus Omnitrophota bacterium]OQX83232.1 MAG: SMC-Scp complex subunit ScpB [Candidatus Omnitrophica bacterium 4484_49]